MRRERGSVLAELILWAIVAAGVMAAFWAVLAWIEGKGADRQRAKDEPIIAAANLRADKAEAANKSLQDDLGNVKAACDISELAVDTFRAQQDAALRASRATVARIDALETRLTGRIATLDEIASAKPAAGSDCANTETDRILRDGARDRMRNSTAGAAK